MPNWLLRAPLGEVPIEGICVIGRSSECTVALDDGNVSRRHAELRLVDGNVQVRDLDSRNGTFVDGKMISGVVQLVDGSRVIVGGTVLTVLASGPSGPPRPRTLPPPSREMAPPAATNTVVTDRTILDRAWVVLREGKLDECGAGVSLVVRRQAGRGPGAEEAVVREASAMLVELATRAKDTRWLEGLFQMNTDCERLIAPELVFAIEALAQPGQIRLLPAYLDRARKRHAAKTNAERETLSRLERLR